MSLSRVGCQSLGLASRDVIGDGTFDDGDGEEFDVLLIIAVKKMINNLLVGRILKIISTRQVHQPIEATNILVD